MTHKEMKKIIERNMPGWHLVKGQKFPKNDKETFLVNVETNGIKKVVVVSDGKVVGMQG